MATILRLLLSGLVLALWSGAGAWAQPAASAPTFALLSLVGDQFTVVQASPETGSRLDPNVRRSFAIDDATLDDVALAAAERVVKTAKPASPVLRFSIRDPRLFELQDRLLSDSSDSRAVREALAKLAREHQATRLVVITKWRDDARFRLRSTTTGTGKVSGLGFYVDAFTRIREVESGQGASGFLGPYAYVNVTIVDVASMTPVRSVQARESEMDLPTHSSGAAAAWNVLTPERKVDALENVLRRAVEKATAAAIAD